ncbi:MAG: hypothetical protein JXL85_07800 [Bacilli bacterium]|nr:hypothetical protein [Bacilli bacterium]
MCMIIRCSAPKGIGGNSRFTLRVIKGRQRRLAVNHFPIDRDRLLRKLNE